MLQSAAIVHIRIEVLHTLWCDMRKSHLLPRATIQDTQELRVPGVRGRRGENKIG